MANVKLLDGTFVSTEYNNVASVSLPKADGTGTVTFYASASASIDYGVETGSSLNAVYFNTQHDTTALDDYLEGADYTQEDTSMGFELRFDILISDSNNYPLVYIASLPAALNSAYIIYAMNGQTPVIFYSTEAFAISGLAVSQGWQMDYASLGGTVTIGAIENDFVAIKDNYIARSAEAYGEWTPDSAIQSSKSVTPGAATQTVTPDRGFSAMAEVEVAGDADLTAGNVKHGVNIFGVTGNYEGDLTAKNVTLGAAAPQTVTPGSGYTGISQVGFTLDSSVITAANIAKDVTILGITGTHEGGGGGKPYSFGAPTVKKNPIYNGGVQSPILKGFVADYMTMGGTTSATEIGSYTMTISLIDTDNSQWSDGSTTPKSVTWQVTAKPAAVPYIVFSSDDPFSVRFSGGKTWDGTTQYSLDNSVWTTWNGESVQASLQNDTYRLFFRGSNTKFNGNTAFHFALSGESIYCDGAIEALINYSTVAGGSMPSIGSNALTFIFYGCGNLASAPQFYATSLAGSCYAYMFQNCTSLTTAPALPATSLANYCYRYMFQNCTSLTSAPALPATSLATECYLRMFDGCVSLTSAPALPATTLATYCYAYMFQNCTSLTSAPALPATTMKDYCCQYMFSGCTSLTTAPALPATTLGINCYQYMFQNCTSLTTAPALPATTLATYCYYNMFQNCVSLTTAPALPATTLATYCYYYMFQNCTSLTTAPALPATTMKQSCYSYMFQNCKSLKFSSTSTGEYIYAYRIPSSDTGSMATSWNSYMFSGTGGTFTSNPSINTTYYTTNPPIVGS